MKRIMIIAGGNWQVPLIKKAKELGYEVLNTNLYEDSIGFQYADYSVTANVLDIDKNLEAAQEYNVDAVLTDQSDIAVPTVAYVAENMGCVTIGQSLAKLFTNKYEMREFCQEKGFKVPEYKLCESIEEAEAFIGQLGKKVIIKPLDSQSSRGVFVIEEKEALKDTFHIAQSYTKDKKHVLVERYIQGTEFTIDGVMTSTGHYSTAISEKSHFEYNPSIARRLFFSYDNAKFDYEKLRNVNDRLIESTGLPFGLTHAEYKYEDGEFYLIEMAARGGGTKISSHIAPYISGIDTYQYLIQTAAGELNEQIINYSEIEKYKNRCAVLEFLDIESNGKKIKEIQGEDEIKNMKGVIDFGLEFTCGDVVGRAEDDRSRAGYFIICADTRDEVETISNQIKERLKITFE